MTSRQRSLAVLCLLWGCGGGAEKSTAPEPQDDPAPPSTPTPTPPAPRTPPEADAAPPRPSEPDAAPAANDARPPAPDVRPAPDGPAGFIDAFLGAPRCASANVAFCEDFENGSIDTTRWTVTQQKAVVGVDAVRAARGKYALHVRVSDVAAMYGNRGQITTRRTFPVAGSRLFMRAFVYIQADPDRWYTVMSAKGTDFSYSLTVVPMITRPGRPGLYRYLWGTGMGEPAEK